jgi:predicted PurR-regulated permease PerM
MWLVPPGRRYFAKRVWAELDPVLRRYFIGVLLVVLYASVAAYIGLGLILNIRHAGFLALLTGILEIIPIIGPAASAIIAGLVAVQQSTTPWSIMAYVIYAAALRISIDQFIGPIVLGKAAYIHPVLVIFCFLSGALLFGLVGVILAVPTAIAIKSTLTVLYREGGKETA